MISFIFFSENGRPIEEKIKACGSFAGNNVHLAAADSPNHQPEKCQHGHHSNELGRPGSSILPQLVTRCQVGKAALAAEGERTTQEYILLGIGLAATIAATVFLTRIARKALKQQPGSE